MSETSAPPPNAPRMELAEEAVELAALSWFELIGWKSVPGDYLAPDGPMGARGDYRETILEPELRSAIASLNPEATSDMVNAAVLKIKASQSQDLIENNRLFHPFLVSGVPVEINEKGTTRTVGIQIIDQEKPHANRLLVANQFIVKGDKGTVRADVTVFVNGLPVAVLELKESIGCDGHIREGAQSTHNLQNQGTGAYAHQSGACDQRREQRAYRVAHGKVGPLRTMAHHRRHWL